MFSERLCLTDLNDKKRKVGNKKEAGSEEMNGTAVDKVKKKKKKKGVDTAEERVQREMQKVMLFQARLAKKKHRQTKIKTVVDKGEFSKKNLGRF